MFACTLAWLVYRQLALGVYLLISAGYQLLLLAYFTHFHFIPSLKLVATMRREAFVVGRELITHKFLSLEGALIALYAGAFFVLYLIYGHQSGVYLDALLRSTAPLSGFGLLILFALGLTWSVKSGQVSMGHMFSYHNMLKWFGPLWWQGAYSIMPPDNSTCMAPVNTVLIAGTQNLRSRDLVFIQLESVGSEMLEAKHEGRAVMPNLQRLAAEAIYFPAVISAKGRGGTSDVELAMFTGRIHQSTDAPILDEFYDYSSSIFTALKSKGYSAFAFHGNSGAFYKRDYAYQKMGADFYDQTRMGLPNAGWGAADGEVLSFAESKLIDVKHPVVAAVILMTSHTPFTNILAIDPRVSGDTFNRYCESLAYVDREIAGFIDRYRQRKPETIFVLYGDHGARIDAHAVNKTCVVEGTKRDLVPGMIVGPVEPRRINTMISMPDLAALSISLAISGELVIRSHCAESVQSLLPRSDSSLPVTNCSEVT